MFTNKAFSKGIDILKKIERHQFQAYFVGGCVRDLLLQRPIGDIDIATSAPPEKVQAIFNKVIPIGIEFGTVIVRYEQESFEVTTFRLDGKYSDQRHPDSVHYTRNINSDLKRRDFTINALAMDKVGNIIDLFNGKEDLHNKLIRTVGNGYERFTEDPLRIIRAVRFASQLGFLIEEKTLKHMSEVKDEIEHIAVERINNEITKTFSGEYVQQAIQYLINTKVFTLLPIFKDNSHVIYKIPKQLKPLHSFGEIMALFHSIERSIPINQWSKAWKASNHSRNEAIKIVKALTYFEDKGIDKWLVYQLPSTYYKGFIRLINILYPNKKLKLDDIIYIEKNLPIQSKTEIAIRGNNIMKIFPKKEKGPWLGKLINDIEKEIVLRQLPNNKAKIKEWIKCHPPEIN